MFHDSGGSDSEDMGDTYTDHPLHADNLDETLSPQRIPGQSYAAVSAGIGGGLFAGLFVRDVPPPDPIIVPDDLSLPDDFSLPDDPSIGAGLEGLGETTNVESTGPGKMALAGGIATKAFSLAAKLADNDKIDDVALRTTNNSQPDMGRAAQGISSEFATPPDGGNLNDERSRLGTVGASVATTATAGGRIGAFIALIQDGEDDNDVDRFSKDGGNDASPSLSSSNQTLQTMSVQAVASAVHDVGDGIGAKASVVGKGIAGVVSSLSTIMFRFLSDLNFLISFKYIVKIVMLCDHYLTLKSISDNCCCNRCACLNCCRGDSRNCCLKKCSH